LEESKTNTQEPKGNYYSFLEFHFPMINERSLIGLGEKYRFSKCPLNTHKNLPIHLLSQISPFDSKSLKEKSLEPKSLNIKVVSCL
jgi:hypothetical protein